MQTQTNLPFEIVLTKDGSPSLVFFKGEHSQMMHSSEGAFSETEYVYGKALDIAFQSSAEPSILSVGLGFGYVELSAVCRAIVTAKKIRILSYEKDELLRKSWKDLLSGHLREDSPLFSSYDKILHLYEKKFSVDQQRITSTLEACNEVQGAMDLKLPPSETFDCILFDPFCSKFSPEFWNEDDLKHFLRATAKTNAVFATYAATGALNRALQQAGFRREPQKGFGVKREFTLALR